jgi:hypothetical protein
LEDFPALIPRLAINVYIDFPIEDSLESVAFRLEKGNDIILQTGAEGPGTKPSAVEIGHDDYTRRVMGLQAVLPPLTVAAPCMLRAIVIVDGVETVAGKLRIAATPAAK